MNNNEKVLTIAPFEFSLGSMGFILGVVFTVLKLCNVIKWSWFWVTFPFWIVPAVSVGLAILVLLIMLIAVGISSLLEKN